MPVKTSPEAIIGTVVGSMLALRKGPNAGTKEVAESVLEQLEVLKAEFQQRDDQIERQRNLISSYREQITDLVGDW